MMIRISERSRRWLLGCALTLAATLPLESAVGAAPKKLPPQDTILYSFAGGPSDGSFPVAGLIADSAGNFYGTTEDGGLNSLGTVFELAADGSETVLYNFAGGASDGSYPAAGLIADSSGNLYGTTVDGGGPGLCDDGCGTVFEVTPGVGESVLYSFAGGPGGANPQASLMADSAGNIYGTTYAGGNATYCEGGCGTVFELSPAGDGTWTETVLYTFNGGTDGAGPLAGLIADRSGNLYGTTSFGGASHRCFGGCGTVFELAPSGNGSWTESVLHFFKPPKDGGDGASPESNLVLDNSGNLYGTTPIGGPKICGGGCGTIFKLSPHNGTWSESLAIKFKAGAGGAFPSGGLIVDSTGTFYGTTEGAGTYNCGTIFKFAPGGKEKPLYSFQANSSDGCNPYGGLIMDQSGNLYGTTALGGASDFGTVFELAE